MPKPTPDPTRLSDSELADIIESDSDTVLVYEAARRLRQRGTETCATWHCAECDTPLGEWGIRGGLVVCRKCGQVERRPEGTCPKA